MRHLSPAHVSDVDVSFVPAVVLMMMMNREPLSTQLSRLRQFPIGTNVRRKFDVGWFDGAVTEVDIPNKLWKVKYTARW